MAIVTENSEKKYLEITGNIPLDLQAGDFISLTRNPPLKIYSLGFQPAKSIPEIPRWFFQKYANLPFTVLEPFAGSGTTIIEAVKNGASVYWLDYHPLSRLNCQIKSSRFSEKDIRLEGTKIINLANTITTVEKTVRFTNKNIWFQKPVQEGLEILRELISKSAPEVQPILWLVFASTVRKSSNMNEGMLLPARRTNVEKIPDLTRADVFNNFQFFLDKAVDAIGEWNNFVKNNNILTKITELPLFDARNIAGNWQIDAIVTSPPYINAIDYVWAAKFELHWLGMVASDEDRLNLYAKEIGTERISKHEYKELGKTGDVYLDELIEEIYTGKKYQASKGQNQLRARVVYKYFNDMKQHFTSSFLQLRSGGYYCFTIGDVSKICGVDIPVAKILTKLACEVGFQEIFHFHLLLKNRKLNIPRNLQWAGSIKHDTTVILQKP